MGKVTGSKNKTDTKLLYKKSNITIRTHSRSCSDASEITKSSLLQIKKNLSKATDYYKDGDKIKRDLSVETGACILRRYYKSKDKRKRSVAPSTAKSKCSTVVDEFTDFKPDHASGDSTNKFELNPIKHLNIDITSLMVQNLKGLLSDWIRQHVLEDSDTKKKLLNVLDSILQSLENQYTKVSSTHSSCSTYIVERNGAGYRVRDRKTETKSITCQYCKHKQTSLVTEPSSSVLFRKYSRYTIPFPYKHLKIISTLSIPRNFYKKDKCRKKQLVYKMKRKDLAITSQNKKERKVVIKVSSCGLSRISKKSFPNGHGKKHSKKKGVIFLPKMLYKSTTDCSSITEVVEEKRNQTTQEDQLDTVPSLVKSIYADDPANITSTDKLKNNDNKSDNFTMTDNNETHTNSTKLINSNPNVHYHEAKYECRKETAQVPNVQGQKYESRTNVDFINETIEFPNLVLPKDAPVKKPSLKSCNGVQKPKSRRKQYKLPQRHKNTSRSMTPSNKRYKYERIRYKHFNYLHKKTKNRNKDDDFLNHFHNVFKYFSNYKGNKNIKLEIHCNVYPFLEVDDKDSKTDIPQEYEIKVVPTEVRNVIPATEMSSFESKGKIKDNIKRESTKSKAEIIPILDGSASQAKYIFKSENSTSISDNSSMLKNCTVKGTAMTGLEVTKELKALKLAIRDLSATAERIVNEHLKRQQERGMNITATYSKPVTTKLLIDSDRQTERLSNLSKGIQFSSARGQLMSGIKLSKGPRRVDNHIQKMKKKSSSYHVIDSEAILRVTDMTASANKSKDGKQSPGIQQKSKSLLNITDDANKQKLIAFFCDTNSKNKNDRIVYRFHPSGPGNFNDPQYARQGNINDQQYARQGNINEQHMGPGNLNDPQYTELTEDPNTPYYASRNSPDKLLLPVNISDYKGRDHEFCSSCYVDIGKPAITVKKRSGMPWWEGLIYCLLLWIPVIVICYFFYDLVIKELNKTEKPKPKTRMGVEAAPDQRNVSRFLLKLSDFGF